MLVKIKFEKFTAFDQLKVNFSPGINIFVGENGTGKTHILKAAYAACDIAKSKGGFAEKINNVFYPSGKQIGRLVKRSSVSSKGSLEVTRRLEDGKKIALRLSLSNHTTKSDKATISGSPKTWTKNPMEAAYIPVKDMMANAPGFRSLYKEREIHFEEIYVDIIDKALLPVRRGPTDKPRKQLLESIQNAMEGRVIAKNEEFFLRNKSGELEFTLPELQRLGVQIFLTTHDYVILKEFDLQSKKVDAIEYHSLFRNKETNEIDISSTDSYLNISPNAIDDTFGSFVDREIERSGRTWKMRLENVDGFSFDFTDALDAFVFDEKDKTRMTYHGQPMKAVA